METKKSPKADLENYRSIFILIGLIIGLALIYWIMGYSVKNVKIQDLQANQQADVEEEQVIYTKRELQPPPPPPPKQQLSDIIEVVNNDVNLKDDYNFDIETDESDTISFEDYDTGDEQPIEEDNKIYNLTDLSQLPQFPGGEAALRRYVAEHIQYPEQAAENDIQGTVYVRFVVTKTGKVGKVEVLRSVDPLLDQEAIRVVKTLPKFKPGMQGGHPVNVWFILPITFKLE